MKKLFTTFLVAVLLSGYGCSESNIVEDAAPLALQSKMLASLNEPDSLGSVASFDADKAFLEECGYDTSDMVEYDEYYTVGTDLVFYKSYVQECRKTPQPKLDYRGTLDPKFQRLYIDAYSFDSSNEQYIKDAVKAWNEIGNCNIHFDTSYDSKSDKTRPYVRVEINQFQVYKNLLTVIDAPLFNHSGTHMYINPDKNLWSEISSDQKKYLVMHGLGHIVGLKDNTNNSFDQTSIMQPESKLSTDKNLWSGFSSFDTSDLRTKYPVIPDPKITYVCEPKAGGDEDWLTVGTSYKITANYTNPAVLNPTYSFSVEKVDATVAWELAPNGNSCTLKCTAPGTCKLVVRILQNGVEKNRFERIYYATIDQFAYPKRQPEIGKFYDFKWDYWMPGRSADVAFTVFFEGEINEFGRATVEQVAKNHVRIRFNDYGCYKVRADFRSNGGTTKTKTYSFGRFYRPGCSIYEQAVAQGPGYELPDYSTEPTGFNYELCYKYGIRFDSPGLSKGRVVIYLTAEYEQEHFKSRRIDRRPIYFPEERRVYEKGLVSPLVVPDLYKMYHPDSLNYKFHISLLHSPRYSYRYPQDYWKLE